MNKFSISAAALVVLITVGSYLFIYPDSAPTTSTRSDTEQAQLTPPDVDTTTEFTIEEIATHDSEQDCWTMIDGKVYDISSYVPRHPGGDEILRACGQDGSTFFNQRATTDGEQVGTGLPHSSVARNLLAEFQVGVIAQ